MLGRHGSSAAAPAGARCAAPQSLHTMPYNRCPSRNIREYYMDLKSLIETYIEEDPERPGPSEARLVDSGVPVWAIIGTLRLAEEPMDDLAPQVAVDYDIPVEAVTAAIRYFEQHRIPIL